MTDPISLIIRRYGKSQPEYEIPNYIGYIPGIGDWITYPNQVYQNSRCNIKIQGRDFEVRDSKLISVSLWI